MAALLVLSSVLPGPALSKKRDFKRVEVYVRWTMVEFDNPLNSFKCVLL
jgi:hypothetical protein